MSQSKHLAVDTEATIVVPLSNSAPSADGNLRFAREINETIQPPREVSGADIEVRALLLVSEKVNQYGGRFDEEGLAAVARLVVDSPILVGHRKDKLPIGRSFRAEVSTIDDTRWVKVWFYWLKETDGSETLATNIDGGVYKECSLGFTFAKPECSLCGADARTCGHYTRESHADDDTANSFIYRGIKNVLEVSLVYRGATPDTRVGVPTLSMELSDPEMSPGIALSIHRLRTLGDHTPPDCLTGVHLGAFPLLDGLPLFMQRAGAEMNLLLDDLSPAPERLRMFLEGPLRDIAKSFPKETLLYGRLIGMRGKERRSLSELVKRIESHSGPVRTTKFRALALLPYSDRDVSDELSALCDSCRWLQHQRPLVGGASGAVAFEELLRTDKAEILIRRSPRENIFTARMGMGSVPVVKSATLGETQLAVDNPSVGSGVALLLAKKISSGGADSNTVAARGCKTLVQPTELLTLEETMIAGTDEHQTTINLPITFANTPVLLFAGNAMKLKSQAETVMVADLSGSRRRSRVVTLKHQGGVRMAALVTSEIDMLDDTKG